MSTYNGEKYLSEQIESILRQDCDAEISLIVRDDGSSDKTTEILDEYKEKELLTWFQGENVRPAKSFWQLIKSNPGYDYYAFADIICKCDTPKKLIMYDTYLSSLCILLGGEFIYDCRTSMEYRLHSDNFDTVTTKEKDGYITVIRARLRMVFHKRRVDVSDQIGDILLNFGDYLTEDGKTACRNLLDSKRCLFKRIGIAFSSALVSSSRSLTLANRLRVLIGNY